MVLLIAVGQDPGWGHSVNGKHCASMQNTFWSKKDTTEAKHPNPMLQEGSFLQTTGAKSLTAHGRLPSFGYRLRALQECGYNRSKQGELHGGGVA